MNLLRILALLLTAVILVPSAAHLFELPGKIGLERDAYVTVQGIYAGWALLSAGLIGASLVVFFIWVFPANQQTVNWTIQPENWQDLRLNWEYGHAVNAAIVFLAFVATCMATVAPKA